MVKLIEVCKKCGSKRGLWTPDAKAPLALRQASPIRVVEPPLDKRIAGIPMPKEFCKDCDKWLGENNPREIEAEELTTEEENEAFYRRSR